MLDFTVLGQDCLLITTFLMGTFCFQDPNSTEEILQEIYDGLEMLRESKLLTPWLVSYLAAHTIRGAKVRHSDGTLKPCLTIHAMVKIPVRKTA